MRATLTRDGREVGVLIMSRDGDVSWDCYEKERERFEDAVKKIIDDLGERSAWVGCDGKPAPVVFKPGDPRWFDRVLARLQNQGFEHVIG